MERLESPRYSPESEEPMECVHTLRESPLMEPVPIAIPSQAENLTRHQSQPSADTDQGKVLPQNQSHPKSPFHDHAPPTSANNDLPELHSLSGSRDTPFSNSNNFLRSLPQDDWPEQFPVSEDILGDVVETMGSLSDLYRDDLAECQALVEEIHNATKDAFLIRRKIVQEVAMYNRMRKWIMTWSNPPRKWAPDAIWFQPIDLKLVDGEYAEMSDNEVERDDKEAENGETLK